MEQNFNKRYVGRFILITIPALIVMGILPFPPIFNLVVMAVIAYFVGKRFAADNARVPTVQEQNQFSVKAFLGVVVIVGVLTTLMFMSAPPEAQDQFLAPFRNKPMSVKIFGTILAVLMMWGSIHSGFSFGARHQMKKSGQGV